MTQAPADGYDPDVVAAAERTHLSWRRTILSALVVGLIAVSKLILASPSPGESAIVVLIPNVGFAIVWFAIMTVARRRMSALRSGRRVLVNRSPGLLALLITTYAALALTLLPRR